MQNLKALTSSIGVFSNAYRYLKKSENNSASLSDLKMQWAQETLQRLKVSLVVNGRPSDLRPVIFVGNHISYLDIPLLMRTIPDISFLAKEEIASWPIFGPGAKALDTIFVKREDYSGRKDAREALKLALKNQKRMALFPSGTTCMTESKEWRYGAFQVAQETGALVQPFRLHYTPIRKTAYIDQDFFPVHLFQLMKVPKISARIEFHEPIQVLDAVKESAQWRDWTRALL